MFLSQSFCTGQVVITDCRKLGHTVHTVLGCPPMAQLLYHIHANQSNSTQYQICGRRVEEGTQHNEVIRLHLFFSGKKICLHWNHHNHPSSRQTVKPNYSATLT